MKFVYELTPMYSGKYDSEVVSRMKVMEKRCNRESRKRFDDKFVLNFFWLEYEVGWVSLCVGLSHTSNENIWCERQKLPVDELYNIQNPKELEAWVNNNLYDCKGGVREQMGSRGKKL